MKNSCMSCVYVYTPVLQASGMCKHNNNVYEENAINTVKSNRSKGGGSEGTPYLKPVSCEGYRKVIKANMWSEKDTPYNKDTQTISHQFQQNINCPHLKLHSTSQPI